MALPVRYWVIRSAAAGAKTSRPSLARQAAENLQAIGPRNVTVVTGPLILGWPAGAPYDAILLNGATEIEPTTLYRQLKDGGRLVALKGRAPAGKAMLYRALGHEGEVGGRPIFDAAAPLLPGFAEQATFVF